MSSENILPTIGILIPTYNRLAFLQEALASVLRQTYGALDIVVMDNGSSDSTAEFMSTISDHRVRYYINDRNLGLAGSINRGATLLGSSVEWLTVLCDDDVLSENFVESMVKYLDDGVAHTIIRSGLKILDVHGIQIREGKPGQLIESAMDYVYERYKGRRETYLSGLFLKRSVFDAIGGYPQFTTGMATDDALIFVFALQNRLYLNPETHVGIRFHDEAESLTNTDFYKHVQALQEYSKYCAQAAAAMNLPSAQLASLDFLLTRFVRKVSSELWMRNVHALFASRQEPKHEDSKNLFRFALQHRYVFTARVVADAWIIANCGFFPERWSIYRSFWRFVTTGRL